MPIIQVIIISIMGGSLATVGVMLGLENRSAKWEEISSAQTEVISNLATIQGEIQKEELSIQKGLTAPDLIKVPCSAEYISQNGEGLCREMFCRLQTREGDAASQSECEEIANLNNTLSIIRSCTAQNIDLEKCTKILYTRK